MPTTSKYLAYRAPLSSEAPDAPGQIGNLVADLDVSNFMRATIADAGTVIGQRAMISGVEYRWDGSAWRIWTWIGVPLATYASFGANASQGGALMECNISGNELTVNFSVNKAAIGIDVAFLIMKAGFRPAGPVYNGGLTLTNGGARFPASFGINANGEISLATNGNNSADIANGQLTYRVAN